MSNKNFFLIFICEIYLKSSAFSKVIMTFSNFEITHPSINLYKDKNISKIINGAIHGKIFKEHTS